jgi:hypothetical protein
MMREHQQGPHRTRRCRAVNLGEPIRARHGRGWPTARTTEYLTGTGSLIRRRRARPTGGPGRIGAVAAGPHTEKNAADEE